MRKMAGDLCSWLQRISDPTDFSWALQNEADSSKVSPYNSIDPLPQLPAEDGVGDAQFSYRGGRDESGRFHGGGTLSFNNGDLLMCDFDHGDRHGEAVVVSPRCDIARLCGTYSRGKLQGMGKVVRNDTSVTDCYFVDSVLHGLARKIEMRKFREFRRQLTFFGRFRDGRPSGVCWQYREGGGFVVGSVDDTTGTFSGSNLAYIYPDMRMAWVGRFQDGVMVEGKQTEVIAITLQKGVLTPLFAPPRGEAVTFSKSTRTFIGEAPLVADPYETRLVECRRSEVPDCPGEGLFAKEDLTAGTVAAFYNGVRLPYELGGPPEHWDTSAYKIFVNADFTSGERMNIPDNYVSLSRYCATLGHKVNHSFTPNCSEWFFEHPRFGVVPCERTTRPVKRGEELLLDYEYDPYNCPKWFEQALRDFVEHATDEEVAELNPKYARFVKSECKR